MKPVDLRNATWSEVREHISDDMLRVHAAWEEFGPGTTRQVAARAAISLLTFRPRTTDLYQVGLVECVARTGTEGVYEYRSEKEASESGAWKEERTPSKRRKAPRANPSIEHVTPTMVRWAAKIMSKAAKNSRKKVTSNDQFELFPAAPGHAA